MQPTTHCETSELDTAALTGASRADVGRFGERIALAHLVGRDHATIVARNWRATIGELRGEIDCVALDHTRRQLVMVEVKCRIGAAHFGGAIAAYPRTKHIKVRRLAGLFIAQQQVAYRRVRIDVIAVDVSANRRRIELTHVVGVP